MTTPAAPGERQELDRRAPENGYHGPSFRAALTHPTNLLELSRR
jgi:hypothetical protein